MATSVRNLKSVGGSKMKLLKETIHFEILNFSKIWKPLKSSKLSCQKGHFGVAVVKRLGSHNANWNPNQR